MLHEDVTCCRISNHQTVTTFHQLHPNKKTKIGIEEVLIALRGLGFCDAAFAQFVAIVNPRAEPMLKLARRAAANRTIQNNMVTHANFGIYANNRMRIDDNINCDEVPYFGFGVGIVVDAGQTQTGSNNLCCDAPEVSTNDGCTLPHEMSGNFHLWP